MRVHSLSCGLGYAFLVESSEGLFLIDSGSPGHQAQVIGRMKELGRTDLKLIWITHAHYDHYGSAAALRRLTGALIGVHPIDAGFLAAGRSPLGTPRQYGFIYPLAQPVVNLIWPLPATPPDFELNDGDSLERYGLDAKVLHTPGHTPGHTCLMLANGVLFAGDVVAGSSSRLKLQSLLATGWDQLPISLDYLKAARPDWVYTGHARSPLPGCALQEVEAG
jgi:glyoxylase-like metal-dependent hydrolase (beta-lactamase superfamily II)